MEVRKETIEAIRAVRKADERQFMTDELTKLLDNMKDVAIRQDDGSLTKVLKLATESRTNVLHFIEAVKQAMVLIEFIGLGESTNCLHCDANKSKARMTEELIFLHLKGETG